MVTRFVCAGDLVNLSQWLVRLMAGKSRDWHNLLVLGLVSQGFQGHWGPELPVPLEHPYFGQCPEVEPIPGVLVVEIEGRSIQNELDADVLINLWPDF